MKKFENYVSNLRVLEGAGKENLENEGKKRRRNYVYIDREGL